LLSQDLVYVILNLLLKILNAILDLGVLVVLSGLSGGILEILFQFIRVLKAALASFACDPVIHLRQILRHLGSFFWT